MRRIQRYAYRILAPHAAIPDCMAKQRRLFPMLAVFCVAGAVPVLAQGLDSPENFARDAEQKNIAAPTRCHPGVR